MNLLGEGGGVCSSQTTFAELMVMQEKLRKYISVCYTAGTSSGVCGELVARRAHQVTGVGLHPQRAWPNVAALEAREHSVRDRPSR